MNMDIYTYESMESTESTKSMKTYYYTINKNNITNILAL